MIWVVENPARFFAEKEAIGKLAAEVEWIEKIVWTIKDDGLIRVSVDITVGAEIFQVELVYPNLFPDTPAYILPRDRTSSQWSVHQYGPGGALCLEWGPDTWHPDVTGADLLRSAHTLLATERGVEQPPASVPSRHRLTLGQEVRVSPRRLLVTKAVGEFVARLPSPWETKLALRTVFHDSARVLVIASAAENSGLSYKAADLPAGLLEFGPLFTWDTAGHLFHANNFPRTGSIANADELLAAIHKAGFAEFAYPAREEGKIDSSEYLFILVGADSHLRSFACAIHGDRLVRECAIVRSQANLDSRLPSEHQTLAAKRVGIVGLGSVGSKVAISLARSGVRKFLLVDDDVLLPENVSRNELTWGAVGVNKVDAVQEALSLISADVEVKCRRTRLAGQESAESASTALEALSNCDILVDATANSAVFLLLAAIAKRKGKPLIWGEVFAGGIGALLMRSRPGLEPHPIEMRTAFHQHLEGLTPAPFIRADNYDADAQGEPIVAFDGEVAEFSAIMARFIADVAIPQPESTFPYSAYLIGFKKAWIFEAPFDVRPLVLQASGAQPEEPTLESRKSAILALVELAEKGADTNSAA